MTEYQLNILNGCLLGDGCLHINKNGKNPVFSYVSCYKEHTEFVSKHFLEYATDLYKNGPIKYQSFDKRTNKTYTRFAFKTKSLNELYEHYHSWYQNKIKIIPKNLLLTNVSNLYWYIGDGCLIKDSRTKKSSDIKLATYCFSNNEVLFLINQLQKYNAILQFNEKNKPYIRIRKKDTKSFLQDIGDQYPKCYQYKWNYSEYKNKKPNFLKKEILNEIIKEYLNKEKTIYALSKKYEVNHASIKYHLKKLNLY